MTCRMGFLLSRISKSQSGKGEYVLQQGRKMVLNPDQLSFCAIR